MTTGNTIGQQIAGATATLTINRPAFGNALSETDLNQLATCMRNCQADPAVRAIVLSGAGKKFFCSGSDIKELSEGVPDIGGHLRIWHEVIDLVADSDKPVIAALNGVAVGGGLELALACHRRIAAAHVRVGLPELKVGLFPAAGGVRRLTRIIGQAKTLKFILSAELLDAHQALALGIVDEVFDGADFDESVIRIARQLSQFESNAVSAVLCCSRMAAKSMDSNDMEVNFLRQCYEAPQNRKLLQDFLSRSKKS